MASVNSGTSENISLNIMPMLDIFSILILFLLMNFSTEPVNYEVNSKLELPRSNTLISLDEVPTIIVSKNAILVNDKAILQLQQGDISEKDMNQGAIYPLYSELEKLAETAKRFSQNKKQTNGLTLEMDKTHNFKLLKKIMISAQQTDFISFKLMVAKNLQ